MSRLAGDANVADSVQSRFRIKGAAILQDNVIS